MSYMLDWGLMTTRTVIGCLFLVEIVSPILWGVFWIGFRFITENKLWGNLFSLKSLIWLRIYNLKSITMVLVSLHFIKSGYQLLEKNVNTAEFVALFVQLNIINNSLQLKFARKGEQISGWVSAFSVMTCKCPWWPLQFNLAPCQPTPPLNAL